VWVFELDEDGNMSAPVQLDGHVIGKSGIGNFSGRLALNDDPNRPVQAPHGGEFHCVIADHGVIDPSDMPDAIKTPIPPFSPDGTQNWEQVVIFFP
jgi:hypothetical protein